MIKNDSLCFVNQSAPVGGWEMGGAGDVVAECMSE